MLDMRLRPDISHEATPRVSEGGASARARRGQPLVPLTPGSGTGSSRLHDTIILVTRHAAARSCRETARWPARLGRQRVVHARLRSLSLSLSLSQNLSESLRLCRRGTAERAQHKDSESPLAGKLRLLS